MSHYKYLPSVWQDGKIIQKNFGSIGHLTGSKMSDRLDSMLSTEEQQKYTLRKRDKNDLVIITEKIDGMNAGVVKMNGCLYPINRKGYDTRLMGSAHPQLRILGNGWAKWVDEHYELYNGILQEGERLVFEYAEFQHTLEYKFRCEPVFLLAKYDVHNKKINYKNLCKLAKANGIMQPPLLNMGVALPPETVISQYPKGLIGVKGGIEGIVYNYEHDGRHESCAKFVSNPLMGSINPLEYLGKRKNTVIY